MEGLAATSTRDLGLCREPVPGVEGAMYSRLNGLPGQAPRVQALDRWVAHLRWVSWSG